MIVTRACESSSRSSGSSVRHDTESCTPRSLATAALPRSSADTTGSPIEPTTDDASSW